MIAVSRSDYNESGCVNCGCEYCQPIALGGPISKYHCIECKTEFMVFEDDFKISPIGYSWDQYDGYIINTNTNGGLLFDDIEQLIRNVDNGTSNIKTVEKNVNEIIEKMKKGVAIQVNGFKYPISIRHPRKGIPKHKLIDIRPENGIGDFCYPRGVGYDLACFVKTKIAGERITDMINKINTEYDNNGFSCRLDYREYEPFYIQIKIDYPNEESAFILSSLITENGNVITEDIVRKAMDMQINHMM